jgi:tetratricopeptide (TPR) repeat protein
MRNGHDERYDFFLSRRGSVAAIACEVAEVLAQKGYKVLVQDYDIPLGANFVEAMHEAVKNSRDIIILFTRDYEQSPYTRKEFTSFEAERAQSSEERHIIVLRCEDAPVRGLLADSVYQDLVGITDSEERRHRIIAAAERQSQAAPPPPRPFIGVPPRVASFTGRAQELDRLDAILLHQIPAAVTQAVGRAAVQGMGGVGKTSLAIEYAHRYRKLYAGVCWCPAETRAGLLSALAALAVTLGATRTDEGNAENAAKAALRRLDEQRATWLLVYDNVTSPDGIADLLPSFGARVLITSRFSDWGGMADEVSLDALPPEEAVALLQARAGRNDTSGASTLAEALGYLPLALDHAAAYCRRTQMRFSDYASKAASLIATVPRATGYPTSVAATFDLAISQAASQCAAAEALVAFFAQCAPERIPMVLVEGAIRDEGERLEALAALAEVSVVKHDPFDDGTEAMTVHRLVQMVARDRSKQRGLAQVAGDCLLARLAEIYPDDGYSNPKSWSLCAQLTPHLLTRQATGAVTPTQAADWADLLNRAGGYFHGRAAYQQAESLLREARTVCETAFGADHPKTAPSLHNLATLLSDQGNLAGARLLYERLLTIDENAFGPVHPGTATSLNNLALLLQAQGDLSNARLLCERALAIREKVLGPEHPDTAQSLHNLASMLQSEGDLTGARPLYERALIINEKVLGREHPNIAAALSNLASILQDQGDLAGARLLCERALTINEKALGPEHPGTATDLSNLAGVLGDAGHADEAVSLHRRAIAIGEKTLGRDHSLTQRYASEYASLLLKAGRAAEALSVVQSALATHEAVFGRNHPWTKDSARIIAGALEALGRAEEAQALRERYGLAKSDKLNPT